MLTTSVTLGSLVSRALLDLQDPATVPLSTTLTGTLAINGTTCSLTDASSVFVSDVLEIGSELLLVTAKTSDAVPVLTVARGYYGSTAVQHTTSEVVYVRPKYPRIRIAEAIKRSFSRLEALGLPLVTSATFRRSTGAKAVVMPATTRDVLRVGYFAGDGRYWDLDAWEFFDDVPTSKISTGKLLRIPRYVSDTDDLEITYRIPYRWSSYPNAPGETDTITMIEGTDELPAVYAAAWILSRREMKRTEIESAEEWNQGEASRSGVSGATVRQQWQEFYRMLDEARRLTPAPAVHRPYRKMQRLTR